MKKRPGAALHSSWNWELISDKTLDWWLPRIRRIKEAFPDRVLIASIMAGSGNDKELQNWQRLARDCQDAGADGLELNFSCPHMDRRDMGSNIGKDEGLCSVVTEAVKEVGHGAGLVQADAGHRGDRGRGGGVLPRRRRRHRLLQHLPLHSAHRSRDAGVRDQRGRLRLERRARRAGDPAALAGEDGADDPGVPRPELLGDRRRLRLQPGAVLHPAGLRHGAGVHRRDARPGGGAERDQAAAGGARRVPRAERGARAGPAWRTSAGSGGTGSWRSPRSAGRTRRTITRGTRRREGYAPPGGGAT